MNKEKKDKIRWFFKLRKNLDDRMVEIDETMNLQKVADVYGECVCKMNGWPVHVRGGYSIHFCEQGFSFMNGYNKALHDNGLCWKNGMVKPIDPNRDIPCGALEFYDEKLRQQILDEAIQALRGVMEYFEPNSKTNQNTIVEAFKEKMMYKENPENQPI